MENLPEGYAIAEVIELHVPQLEGERHRGDYAKIELILSKMWKNVARECYKNKGHLPF